jgi:hypothetical protein
MGGAETCPVSTGGRDETCPVSTGGRGGGGAGWAARAPRHREPMPRAARTRGTGVGFSCLRHVDAGHRNLRMKEKVNPSANGGLRAAEGSGGGATRNCRASESTNAPAAAPT